MNATFVCLYPTVGRISQIVTFCTIRYFLFKTTLYHIGTCDILTCGGCDSVFFINIRSLFSYSPCICAYSVMSSEIHLSL